MYISEAELRKPPYNIAESEMDKTYADMLIGLTKEFIDETCNQSFDKEGDTGSEVEKRLDGHDKIIMFLPKRIIELKEIKDYNSDASFTTFSADNFVVHPRYIEWKDFSTQSSRVLRDFFVRGIANIGIVGVWGWEPTPLQIKHAQGLLIVEQIRSGALVQKYDSEKVGSYTKTILKDGREQTFNTEVDLLLRRFRDFKFHEGRTA